MTVDKPTMPASAVLTEAARKVRVDVRVTVQAPSSERMHAVDVAPMAE